MKKQITAAMRSYLMMKTSLEKYSKIVSELTAKEHQQLLTIIEKTLSLYKAVLASDEASKTPLPLTKVKDALQELKSRFSQEKDFSIVLKANKLDEESILLVLQNEIHCEEVLRNISNDCQVMPDQQVQVYYFKNIEKFKQPERRRARHILITINSDFSENTAVNARKRLDDIVQELNADNFSWYAERNSECPTAMNAGQLGLVERGKLHYELEQQLFSMGAQTISDITETEIGLHLLLCEEIQPAHTISYQQAKEKIIEQHLNAARIRKQKLWIAGLLNQNHLVS
ncbi:MAG: peptidylprolyl isomerase [Colwellia sp.]